MSVSRVEAVRAILEREYPYKIPVTTIRRVLNVLPVTRKKYRVGQYKFVAAVVALPYRVSK